MTPTLREECVVEPVIDVPLREVLRMMGCGNKTSNDSIVATARRLLDEALPRIRPRAVYRVCDVTGMTDSRIDLAGWPSFEGPISGFLKPARRVAVYVVTIGNATQELGNRRIQEGNVFEGYCFHAIGAAAADMAADAMADLIRDRETTPAEDITPPFSPGYCGMGLDQQRVLFSIVHGAKIGVTLRPTFFMEPAKSISGVIGIGPEEEIVEHGVPCEWCELTTCKMRRE